jgi:hypothetical protein
MRSKDTNGWNSPVFAVICSISCALKLALHVPPLPSSAQADSNSAGARAAEPATLRRLNT